MKYAIHLVFGLVLLAPAAFAQTPSCPSPGTISKAKKSFVVPYQASADAMQKGQYAVALGLAVEAAPNASDAKQLQAALAVRSAALAGLKDDAALIEVLEQRLLLGCHDASQSREDIQDQLRAARMRLGQR